MSQTATLHHSGTTTGVARAGAKRPAVPTTGPDSLGPFAPVDDGRRRMPITVTGPSGQPVSTQWWLLPDGTGLVDLAATTGIHRLAEINPMIMHTRGFGQVIAAALDEGVPRLLLNLGGSCSIDGGTGMLRELGVVFLDKHNRPIRDGGIGLVDLATVDLSGIRSCPADGVVIVTAESTTLLGRGGPAVTLAPDLSASGLDRAAVEVGLQRLASFHLLPLVKHLPTHQIPGSGAAGGIAYGLWIWLAHAGRHSGDQLVR